MRVMVIVKATKNSEAGVMPSEELFDAMGRFNEELVEAGVMLMGEGLRPSAAGKRILFSGGERRVVDGPFPETTQLVAGFWIWQVSSMEEALSWALRCPDPMPGEEAALEIRPIMEIEEFGDDVPAALRKREERLRAEIERRKS